MVGGAYISSKQYTVLLFCIGLLSLYFMKEILYLEKNLQTSSLFTLIPYEDKKLVVVWYTCNKTQFMLAFMGLTYHVVLMAQMEQTELEFQKDVTKRQKTLLIEIMTYFYQRR